MGHSTGGRRGLEKIWDGRTGSPTVSEGGGTRHRPKKTGTGTEPGTGLKLDRRH